MDWRQFTMHLNTLEADKVERVFARHGAQSVTFSDAGDNPVLEPAPGETPLWAETEITGLFSTDADLRLLREDLLLSFGLRDLPSNRTEDLPEREWEREWLKDFRPMKFGDRLWISPNHMQVRDASAIVVKLDPGLAFGTGTHETTALCLEWLDGLDLRGRRVLDVGCGSGVLSIAALKLGAERVHGIDLDQQAIDASRRNAQANDVGERLTLFTDTDELGGDYDIVVANILATTLIDLAGNISRRTRPGGKLALSGILGEQIDDVSSAYRQWIELDPAVERNNWARLTGMRQ